VRLLNLDVLDPDAGLRLFAERYADRGGVWDAARDETAARSIVAALGGLPLAIELAAARAARTHLPLATLAEELRAPDALARLSDPIDPSAGVRYSLRKTLLVLSPTQRARFAALGLPEGPDWPQPIVERMLEGMVASAPPVASARADLEALAAYSLISLVAPQGEDAPRVRLHPLVRELARDECAQQMGKRAALAGLLAGVHDWIVERARDYDLLARDEDLIAGALRTAAEHQIDLPLVIGTISAFDTYLFTHNFPLREELVRVQLASARTVEDRKGELIALHRLMSTLAFLGRSGERYACAREAVSVARMLGDPKELASALGAAAAAARDHGHLDEAQELYGEASGIADTLEVGRGMAGVFTNLADAAAKLGKLHEAANLFARALASAQLGGVHPVTMLILYHNYGDVCTLLGDYASARQYHEEAVAMVRALQPGTEAVDLENLGEIALRTGDVEAASRLFHEALHQVLESPFFAGAAQMVAHVRGNLAATAGEIARLRGDLQEARQDYEEALAIFERDETPFNHYTREYEDFVRERLAMITRSPRNG
jgi:tetratricopeptide (TPR) repeat protein